MYFQKVSDNINWSLKRYFNECMHNYDSQALKFTYTIFTCNCFPIRDYPGLACYMFFGRSAFGKFHGSLINSSNSLYRKKILSEIHSSHFEIFISNADTSKWQNFRNMVLCEYYLWITLLTIFFKSILTI